MFLGPQGPTDTQSILDFGYHTVHQLTDFPICNSRIFCLNSREFSLSAGLVDFHVVCLGLDIELG